MQIIQMLDYIKGNVCSYMHLMLNNIIFNNINVLTILFTTIK